MTTRLQKEDITSIVKEVTDKIVSEMNKNFAALNKQLASLQQQLKEKDTVIDALNKEVDRLHQYSRRNCVRVFGVPETRNESTDVVVQKLCQEKLGVTLNPTAIDRCHRLGRHNSDKCRPIIIKFTRYYDRASVYKSKSKLKGTGIVIREDLTQIRLDILNASKQKFGLRNTWSTDGVICVKIGDHIHKITTMQQFNELKV